MPSSIISTFGLSVEDVGLSNVYYMFLFENKDLSVISYSEDNDVWIYSLDEGVIKLETELTLGALTPYKYTSSREYLKVVSEEPVMIYVGVIDATFDEASYYPSVTGQFIGEEYIIYAISPTLEIYALGDGVVEVKNDTDITYLPVFEDTVSKLNVTKDSFYNITSPVQLMVSTSYDPAKGNIWLSAPSTTGQFVGEIHYGYTRIYSAPDRGAFQVVAYEPGVVSVINLTDPSDIIQHTFIQAGEVWHQSGYEDTPIKVEGDIDTFVQTGLSEFDQNNIFYSGQAHIGGRVIDGDEIEYWAWIFCDSGNKGVIFAPEDITFTLNGTEVDMEADEYQDLLCGKIYHITSPKPLVIQQHDRLGGYVVAPSGIPANKPEVTEEPADNTMIYVGVAAVAIIVVAALGYFLMKKR
jgi:hypothetical protein